MRLQDRFKKLFILPLIIGITISLAVTAYFLVEVTKFYDNENLLKVLNVVEIDMNIPLIETTKLIIYRKFQKPLDDIDLIKKYFYYYANIVNSSIEFENINNSSDLKNGSYYSNLINDFSYNSLFLSRNDKTNFKILNNSKSDLQGNF